jgi:flagellar protein FlgJ
MTDTIALPKLPLDLSNAIVDAPTRLQRTLNAKKSAPDGSANDPELLEPCRQMESLFIYHLFKEMRATIHKAGFISGGRAEEIYTSMMDAEMAAKLSNRDGIGLARMLLHQLGNANAEGAREDTDMP